jgi:hypothetical protein
MTSIVAVDFFYFRSRGSGSGYLAVLFLLDRKDKQAIILVVLMYNTTDCLLVFGRRTKETSLIYMGYLLAFVWDI